LIEEWNRMPTSPVFLRNNIIYSAGLPWGDRVQETGQNYVEVQPQVQRSSFSWEWMVFRFGTTNLGSQEKQRVLSTNSHEYKRQQEMTAKLAELPPRILTRKRSIREGPLRWAIVVTQAPSTPRHKRAQNERMRHPCPTSLDQVQPIFHRRVAQPFWIQCPHSQSNQSRISLSEQSGCKMESQTQLVS
jgi:hypothetical protein